jgi:inosose dehydratase
VAKSSGVTFNVGMNMEHCQPLISSRKHTRREFLCGLAAAGAAAVSCLPHDALAAAKNTPQPKSLVGSNIYVWTQYAKREKRELDMAGVISALRDAGYDYLESFMDLEQPENIGKLAEQFKAKGLQPVSLYVGPELHSAKAKESMAKVLAAAKICQQAGFQVLSCNAKPIGREKTDEELKTQVAALIDLGEGLKSLGMKLGVHHHLPEMANSAREFHYNFRNSKPDVVGFCYDVHWVWKGGIAPLDAMKEYGDRIVTWHLRQSRDKVWLEDLDTGDVDYAAVAQYAQEHNLPRRFSVELALEAGTKITRSVVENHRRSREFVRRVFGA